MVVVVVSAMTPHPRVTFWYVSIHKSVDYAFVLSGTTIFVMPPTLLSS